MPRTRRGATTRSSTRPGWSIAALIAKIHTVEWTTAILGHPALQIGMRANWFGLAEERVHRLFGRISDSEVISGIPGSATDHHSAPYSITEEFVAVYRMHPLVPDDSSLRSIARPTTWSTGRSSSTGAACGRAACSSGTGSPTCSTRSAPPHPGRGHACTTTRGSCSASAATTAC